MTHLRKMMLEELERRNYAQTTTRLYLQTIEDFARYFHRSPDQLGPEHIREYQAYLFRERKLAAGTVTQRLAALRFFFIQTMKKPSLETDRCSCGLYLSRLGQKPYAGGARSRRSRSDLHIRTHDFRLSRN